MLKTWRCSQLVINNMNFIKQNWFKIILIIVIFILVVYIIFFRAKNNFVDVEYRGEKVDISGFQYLNTEKSSFVEGAWYNSSNNHLILKLNETYYEYCNVSNSVWESLKLADSFGSYYNSKIKNRFYCLENDIESIKSSEFYEVCLEEAIKYEEDFLISKGYTEQNDGSWKDDEGFYPGEDFDENEMELLQTDILFNCLEKHE